MATTITGCGSELQPKPTATADIPATVSAAVALALGTPGLQPTAAPPEPRRAATSPASPESQPDGTPNMEATINAAVANYSLAEDPESLEFWAIATPDDARRRLDQDPGVLDAKDELGRTPLKVAVSRNTDPEVTMVLLERRRSFPTNILHSAVYNSNPDVIRLLLDVGADIMAEDQLVGLDAVAYRGLGLLQHLSYCGVGGTGRGRQCRRLPRAYAMRDGTGFAVGWNRRLPMVRVR